MAGLDELKFFDAVLFEDCISLELFSEIVSTLPISIY